PAGASAVTACWAGPSVGADLGPGGVPGQRRDPVQAAGRGDVDVGTVGPAEAQVRRRLGQPDRAELLAGWGVDRDTGPGGSPDVAVRVHPQPVRHLVRHGDHGPAVLAPAVHDVVRPDVPVPLAGVDTGAGPGRVGDVEHALV